MMMENPPNFAFGFSKRIYERANAKMALSKMTFSHQMVRLFFVEQLYRGFTILKGEKILCEEERRRRYMISISLVSYVYTLTTHYILKIVVSSSLRRATQVMT